MGDIDVEALEVGLPFTFEDAKAAAEGDREVSLDDADSVSGGEDVPSYEKSMCFAIGINGDPDADGCMDDFYGGGACAYVGVGLVWW